MKGQVLDFSVQEGKGIITSEDGKRYIFAGSEWKEPVTPVRGMAVDFDTDNEGNAVGVYRALKGSGAGISLPSLNHAGGERQKSRISEGLLAFFLGGFGAHKFYLGMPVPGLIYLLVNIVSWILIAITENVAFYLPCFVISCFCLADAVIYWTRSDEDFQRLYVEDKKQWF